ncbi:holin-associated N-acetylmuramidase [Seohaeicola saemankumensis]|jgi:lysozyme family protein|uniref:holin-associated N-acetylmuramidase n=1 Tax=Seohaeicola TaxID=481178 RepID=UPI0007F47B06|nr:holin-associated N-acetylmuramidase [Paracoccaceae bacterium]OAN68320.1 peptidoglycan-binding protein [Rhodobacteraceae bacterium EhC02]
MHNVRQIAEQIVAREGGFVNDPADPGGATKHGVTIGTLRRLGLDLNHDGAITVDDVEAMTRPRAADIFILHYFQRPGLDKLPLGIQASVFDMYVNAGANAVKILQRLLRQMGQPVAVDGVVGPQTIAAAEAAHAAAPGHLADAYGIARRNYYLRLADLRPASRKFARSRSGGKGGWVLRAEEFIHPRYHLSAAEFAARVAQWH